MKDKKNDLTGRDEPAETAEPDNAVRKTVFEFAGHGPTWHTVNDDVMGGVSTSTVSADAGSGNLVFSGILSLANNGGFASIRSQWSRHDLANYDGIVLRARGDGRVYQFRVRTEEEGEKISYTASFATERGTWKDIDISFADMTPIYRGVVRQAPVLDPGSIRSFGFMLADKQAGQFRLEVARLDAVAAGNDPV